MPKRWSLCHKGLPHDLVCSSRTALATSPQLGLMIFRRRKFIILSLLICLSTSLGSEIEIRQAIGEIIKKEGKILTGSNSRVEVEFPSATVRIGSNADFRYAADYREMSLNRGTILLSARDDAVIYAGLVTMKTSQGAFQCSNIPGARIKVIVLDGKVRVHFAGARAHLRYGEILEIPYEATKMPRSKVIDLEKLMETSVLLKMGPLRNQWKLEYNIERQKQKPHVPSLVNSPPMVEVARATATAGAAHAIERQQALLAQQAANEQVIADRRVQRLINQGAPQSEIRQAERVANQAANQAGNPPTQPARPPRPTRPDFGRPGQPGRPDIGRPGRPGLPGIPVVGRPGPPGQNLPGGSPIPPVIPQ